MMSRVASSRSKWLLWTCIRRLTERRTVACEHPIEVNAGPDTRIRTQIPKRFSFTDGSFVYK
jgi:hypothetical protein